MATKSKKTVRNNLQTIRPGEIGVRSLNGRVFLSDAALNRPSVPLDNFAHGIVPGDVNIVPARLYTEAIRIGLEIVAGATEGIIPPRINVADTRARAVFRDGKPPGPTRDERIRGWRDTLVDGSFSEAVVNVLVAMDLPDDMRDPRAAAVARELVRVFDRAYLEPRNSPDRAFHQPWIRRSQELIALHRAREAGLVDVPAQPAQGGGE